MFIGKSVLIGISDMAFSHKKDYIKQILKYTVFMLFVH